MELCEQGKETESTENATPKRKTVVLDEEMMYLPESISCENNNDPEPDKTTDKPAGTRHCSRTPILEVKYGAI